MTKMNFLHDRLSTLSARDPNALARIASAALGVTLLTSACTSAEIAPDSVDDKQIQQETAVEERVVDNTEATTDYPASYFTSPERLDNYETLITDIAELVRTIDTDGPDVVVFEGEKFDEYEVTVPYIEADGSLTGLARFNDKGEATAAGSKVLSDGVMVQTTAEQTASGLVVNAVNTADANARVAIGLGGPIPEEGIETIDADAAEFADWMVQDALREAKRVLLESRD